MLFLYLVFFYSTWYLPSDMCVALGTWYVEGNPESNDFRRHRCYNQTQNVIPSTSVSAAINPFRTAVPFWGQTSQILSSLSPKRDWGSKGVKKQENCSRLDHLVSETPLLYVILKVYRLGWRRLARTLQSMPLTTRAIRRYHQGIVFFFWLLVTAGE